MSVVVLMNDSAPRVTNRSGATEALPLFVFNGLDLVRERDPRNITASVALAWSHVENGWAREGVFQVHKFFVVDTRVFAAVHGLTL